ncbi:hypothetical protein COO60DRAFT_276872 [Scenedesmus sp. NREL 46B-D3]|nr:hypothetical protein COO60DRAFT_276872 [Scenedesmus sp. NREL 46B-D3]
MSRRMRPSRGGGAYVPPHLRNGAAVVGEAAAGALAAAPGRSLDELAPHNMSIKLTYTINSPFSLDGCPDNIEEQRAEEQQHSADAVTSDTAAQLAVSPACSSSDLCMPLHLPLITHCACYHYVGAGLFTAFPKVVQSTQDEGRHLHSRLQL